MARVATAMARTTAAASAPTRPRPAGRVRLAREQRVGDDVIEKLIRMTSADARLELIKQNEAAIDEQFFSLFSRTALVGHFDGHLELVHWKADDHLPTPTRPAMMALRQTA